MAMEGLLQRLCPAVSFFMIISSLAVISSQAQSSAAAGAIELSKSQLIIASLQPSIDSLVPATAISSQLFLTSPSGNSAAYLIRLGQGFCYIQVQENGNGIWGSTCAPVTGGNACILAFSDAGLQIFDGSRSSWRSNTNRGHLHFLVLTDAGEMEILNRRGTIVWAASQEQITNRNCGFNSSPSPFATPSYNAEPSLGQGTEEDGGLSPPQLTYPSGLGQVQNYPQQLGNVAGGFPGSFNPPFSSFNQLVGGNGVGSLGDGDISTLDNGVPHKGLFLTVVNLALACLLPLMISHQFL